jgi:hypothetical protein
VRSLSILLDLVSVRQPAASRWSYRAFIGSCRGSVGRRESLFARSQLRSGAEDRCTDADVGSTKTNCYRKIRRHTHGEEAQSVAGGNLGREGKMRGRRFINRRNAHETRNREPISIAASFQEIVCRLRQYSRFLRFGASVDLDEQDRRPTLPLDLFGKRGAQARSIDSMNCVEDLDGFFRLVRLQRTDQVELHTREAVAERWPFGACLLYAVFAKDALALVQNWQNRVRRKCL